MPNYASKDETHPLGAWTGPDEFVMDVPGYQRVAVDVDRNGVRYLYMGGNFVAFTPREWANFTGMISATA